MSVLLSLKEWVTLEEAAQHLSAVFKESVSLADIYRFSLSGHLTISSNFVNHARVRKGRKMAIRDAGFRMLPDFIRDKEDIEPRTRLNFAEETMPEFRAWLEKDIGNMELFTTPEPSRKFFMINGNRISATDCMQFDKEVTSIEGIWDLAMIGAERLDIEHALQFEIGGPEITLVHLDGVYLTRADGEIAWLQEHFKNNECASERQAKMAWDDDNAYYPAGGLPPDSVLVVRTKNLLQFIENTTGGGQSPEKPLDERERTTLLCIIGALANLSKLDLSEPFKAANQVQILLEQSGVKSPAVNTIGRHLQKAKDALTNRSQ